MFFTFRSIPFAFFFSSLIYVKKNHFFCLSIFFSFLIPFLRKYVCVCICTVWVLMPCWEAHQLRKINTVNIKFLSFLQRANDQVEMRRTRNNIIMSFINSTEINDEVIDPSNLYKLIMMMMMIWTICSSHIDKSNIPYRELWIGKTFLIFETF